MTVDLDFGGAWTPPAAGATGLDFAPSVEVAPRAANASIQIRLQPPTGRIRAIYNNLVSRKLESDARMAWQRSARQADAVQGSWGDTAGHRGEAAFAWQHSQQRTATLTSPSAENASMRQASRLCWDGTRPNTESTASRLDSLRPQREQLCHPWEEGLRTSCSAVAPFVWLVPRHIQHATTWQQGQARSRHSHFEFAPGVWRSGQWALPWKTGDQPRPGESRFPQAPPVEPPSPNHHPALDFVCPAATQGSGWRPLLRLNFGLHPCPSSDDPGTFSVPVLKVYFVSNSVAVVRLPGRESIPVKSIQLSIDADSWAWGFSASLPYSALELIEPTSTGPVEIEITVNGVKWVMLVESFDVRREFGQSSLGIQGRSLAAYLSHPYAPKRSFVSDVPITARQLAEQELARTDLPPGLAAGFDLDWRLPDWLVPAGSWNYESASPMEVMSRIAGAVGGYINAHTWRRSLVAKSRYPELPWNWAALTPDRILPLDVVKTLNLRWQEKPSFNAVYVSGERQGVTGRVIRSGTAGDVLAPMLVDGLMTHVDAIRERGRAVLADVSKQAMVTLELPMFASLGLIEPGLLISVGADRSGGDRGWRGLVRATSISAQWSDGLSVRQNIEVERHYGRDL